ncbi:MAG: helix-turn-helix transcriptional regulator [Candidatus Omnitrophica bacterium]|jgi:hypothetical protein|nr:helix-turn-helix transcriptional regulator [Candidatus Omnitrophota bacterium]MDD5517892.1 helix-turn-helix transcriptional regulator [Candidatus Omnitrophota bacterium]
MQKYKDIEAFYRIEWKKLLRKFYLIKRMSSYEIAEKIQDDMGMNYTYRAVELWLEKFGFIRTHAEALKNSLLMGRKDYSNRKIDYEVRFVDYAARDKKRGYLWAIGLKKLLTNKGDTLSLARALGSENIDISDWKNLRHRVSPEYQEKICAYFGFNKLQIFSENKVFDIPKIYFGSGINKKYKLREQGYRYATNLKKIIYGKHLSINDLADKLGKPYTSVSRWISGKHLVAPTEQARIENILRVSADQIFS